MLERGNQTGIAQWPGLCGRLRQPQTAYCREASPFALLRAQLGISGTVPVDAGPVDCYHLAA